MNVVFERFLRRSLRAALGLDEATFPDRAPSLQLDNGGRAPLKPDLCVVQGTRLLWIGDAKYKRLPPSAYQNADLYQCSRTRLRLGSLTARSSMLQIGE
jgi:5-methylcytosine-specific restriction endonuclease McrBC regulatory subunit McrC